MMEIHFLQMLGILVLLMSKYMAELLGIKVITHGLWHARRMIPADFLGRLIGNAKWVRHAERSTFESFDS